MDRYCNEKKDCKTCAGTNGCAWCGEAKKCVLKTTMNGDPKCNADNAIFLKEDCSAAQSAMQPDTEEAYHEIPQKPHPPAVFTNPDQLYSPETVMASMGQMRGEIKKLQEELPQIIRTTVRQTLQPAPFHPQEAEKPMKKKAT